MRKSLRTWTPIEGTDTLPLTMTACGAIHVEDGVAVQMWWCIDMDVSTKVVRTYLNMYIA